MKKISSLGLTLREEEAIDFLIDNQIDALSYRLDIASSQQSKDNLNSEILLFKNLQSKLFEDT